jgi:hypothetical protein
VVVRREYARAAQGPALTGSRAQRALDVALAVIAALTIAAVVVLAWVHVDDRYRVDHVDGARMALARQANMGTLYPPLRQDGFYGGTRSMPIPVVLDAAAARLTDEYLVSGKLIAYTTMIGLVLATFFLLKSLRCPLPLAASLATMVLLTQAGLGVAMSLRGDALPVLLQVLSVWVATLRRSRSATIGAALLAALALVAKLSAVWAPMAIVLWLLVRDRRRLALFVGSYLAFAVALLGIFGAVSDGRLFANVFGLAGAGLADGSLPAAPYHLARLAADQITPTWFLLPAVGLAVWYAMRYRHDEEWLLALACSAAVLVVVFADIGADWNHLIDVVVLVAVVIGSLVGRTLPARPEGLLLIAVLTIGVLWVSATSLITYLLPETRQAVYVARAGVGFDLDPRPLRGLATSETSLLAEDPYLPVILGQRPIVLDPFMFRRIAREDPGAAASLARRIRAREFDLIVLLKRVENEDLSWWWDDYHFGPEVAAAIRDAYTYRETRGPYHVYEPAA